MGDLSKNFSGYEMQLLIQFDRVLLRMPS